MIWLRKFLFCLSRRPMERLTLRKFWSISFCRSCSSLCSKACLLSRYYRSIASFFFGSISMPSDENVCLMLRRMVPRMRERDFCSRMRLILLLEPTMKASREMLAGGGESMRKSSPTCLELSFPCLLLNETPRCLSKLLYCSISTWAIALVASFTLDCTLGLRFDKARLFWFNLGPYPGGDFGFYWGTAMLT